MIPKTTSYNFFAVQEDLTLVFRAAERQLSLKYVETGLFDDPQRMVLTSFLELPNLGLAQTGNSNSEPTFLVLLSDAKVQVRTVPQRRGAMKYGVDQLENPGTVVIRPGGRFGDSALIAGMLGTVHTDSDALAILQAFCKPVEQLFTKTRSYFVGPGAGELFELGVRLTKNVKNSKEFDLQGGDDNSTRE